MAHTLNVDHRIEYFREHDPRKVLKQASKFIKENPGQHVSSFTMNVEWDDATEELVWVAYMINGGW